MLNGHLKPILTRLGESAIIGGIILFGTVQVLGERINGIKEQVSALSHDLEKIKNDFYKPRWLRSDDERK
jgi:hypothetical protein